MKSLFNHVPGVGNQGQQRLYPFDDWRPIRPSSGGSPHPGFLRGSWQGSRKGAGLQNDTNGNQAVFVSQTVERIKAKQARLGRLLDESKKLFVQLDAEISQLGKPRQPGLPYIAYALKHEKTYRGNGS